MRKILLLTVFLTFFCLGHAQTKQEADSLHEAGRALLDQGKAVEGRELTLKAMELRKKLFDEVSEDYITSLNNYASSFQIEDDYAKAKEIQEQVMALCGKLKTPHKKLYLFTRNMSNYCYQTGDMKSCAKYLEQCLPLVEKFGEEYEKMLGTLSALYEMELDDKEGSMRIMELIKEFMEHVVSMDCNEPKCMMEKARYYQSLGDHSKTKECYLQLMDMPMTTEQKAEACEAYAMFLYGRRDRAGAVDYFKMAARYENELNGKSGKYARMMYLAGVMSFALNQYDQAIDCYQEALGFYSQDKAEDAMKNKLNCLKGIGNAHSGKKDYSKAADYFKQMLDYYEQQAPQDEEYPKTILRLAKAEKFNKEYDVSIEHHKQAMKMFRERDMMEDYGDAANSLSLCYAYAGKKEEVEDLEEEVMAVRKAKIETEMQEIKDGLELDSLYLGALSYASSLSILASYSANLKDYPGAVAYYKEYIKVLRDAVRNEFLLQDEKERAVSWGQIHHSIQEMNELLLTLANEDKKLAEDLAEACYDAELISKGILLSSSIEFERLLAEQPDKSLQTLYGQYKDNEKEIARLRREAKSDNELERILKLTQQNQTLQLQLYKGCAAYGDYTKYLSYGWQDVCKTLQPGDIAIEFAAIQDFAVEKKERAMLAIITAKDLPRPVTVTIWDDEHLIACDESADYKALIDSILREMIILHHRPYEELKGTLHKRMDDIAHSNSQYKTELALYLKHIEAKFLADSTYKPYLEIIGLMKYQQLLGNCLRFCETEAAGDLVWGSLSPFLEGRKRVFFSADGCLNRLAVEYLPYGGKPFSEKFETYRLSSTKELCIGRPKVKYNKAAIFGDIDYNGDATSTEESRQALASLRGSSGDDVFANLGNTRREVNDVQKILKEANVKDVAKWTDTEASAETFKGLSDSKVNLVHIATHGMFRDAAGSTEDESMDNSILAFAGANLGEEGVVTAADVAKMNLRSCDLAVLSACETGLGKLGDDGVFGLQRGFKNAGVHTLLMSLKSVHDQATADMMVSFYRHLMNGDSKREALVKAQQELRQRGFTDSDYWATFILLDAF